MMLNKKIIRMKGVPIKPSEIPAKKAEVIPPFVIDAVNHLLIERSDGRAIITILQKDIVNLIKETHSGDFNYNWLNFEDAYRASGWVVRYDKPAYCESYDPYFEFSQK